MHKRIVALALVALVTCAMTSAGAASVSDATGDPSWVGRAGATAGRTVPMDIFRGVTYDDRGFLYGVGTLGNDGTIDDGLGGTVPLVTAGAAVVEDVLVSKWSPDGVLQWAKTFGGPSLDQSFMIGPGPDGDLVLCGFSIGNATFGDKTFAGGRGNAFVARITTAGDVVWVKPVAVAAAPGSLAFGSECRADAAGDVIVAGSFRGSATIGTNTITADAAQEGFVAKLDSTGAFQWMTHIDAHTAGTSIGPRALEVAADGETLIVGGTVRGSTTIGAVTHEASGDADGFVGTLSADGAWQWLTFVAGAGADEVRGVAAIDGDVIVGGKYEQSVSLVHDGTAGPVVLTSNGGTDAFALRLAGDGTAARWATTIGSTEADAPATFDEGLEVSVGPGGTVLGGGGFQGTAWVGPAGAAGPSATALSGADLLLVLLDGATGAGIWISEPMGSADQPGCVTAVRNDPEPCDEYLYSVETSDFGDHGFGGFFQATSMLGSLALTSVGGEDAVIGAVRGARFDVRPDDSTNRIVIGANGYVPVVIHGSPVLDVDDIALDSLRFAPAGASAHRARTITDVDGDGHVDLLTRFHIRDSGLTGADHHVCVTGLVDDQPFTACDRVQTR